MQAEHPQITTKIITGRIVQTWSPEEDAILLSETLQCEEEHGKKA